MGLGPGAQRFGSRNLQAAARSKLRQFRQGSTLAVALTGLFLLISGGAPIPAQEPAERTSEAVTNTLANDALQTPTVSLEQATGTISDMFAAGLGLLPKILIALLILGLAGLVAKVAQVALRRTLGSWARTDALVALSKIGIFLVGIAAALTVIAGDVRALLGSLGLIGLALSWALQTPIESFTGWLLNSFRGYYRVGDRIEVGDVFGDVYKIDVLTTTVWEAGGPGKSVTAAQATGAMITFPNWEVLRSNIVNYSRDFPFVWDEITVGVANESDLHYTMGVLQKVACSVLGDVMVEPTHQYRQLLTEARLKFDVEEEPTVFLSSAESWTNCTVRYLVPTRTRRRWATQLLLAISRETSRPEHQGKIIPAYPRQEISMRTRQQPP